MEKSKFICAVYFLFSCFIVGVLGQYFGQPEQIHLSYGVDPSSMVVTWLTFNSTNPEFVEYGATIDTLTVAKATETKFVDGGTKRSVRFVYRAWMTGLTPGNKYVYRVGNDRSGWSSMYHFMAQRNDSSFQPRFAIVGDLGNSNPQSLPRLQMDTEDGMYDALLHVGDFAYDFFTDQGNVGDEFMRQMQPIATQIPYMTCPGNHEYAYNFSHYKQRFAMPTDEYGERMYYSMDIGPVHLISFSSEFLFYWEFGFWQVLNQYQWLVEDLQKANTPEARAKHPWIVTMAHRPMYCSNIGGGDCLLYESRVRTGLPFVHKLGYEDLFYKYGVDVSLWAHQHSYERMFPLYNFQTKNGSYDHPYTNPKGIVHITTGSAGCREDHTGFKLKQPPWSAIRVNDYSYSRMKVYNSTHLYMELVSDDKHGKIMDQVMIIKDHHGPYE